MSENSVYTPPIPALKFAGKELTGGYNHWCAVREQQTHSKYFLRRHATLLFSVIVPVHNPAEHWLQECIDSVRSQFFANWELILADDASTQATLDLLNKNQALDERIKVSYLSHKTGISSTTNRAVDLAKGDFLVFLDHDDLLDAYALSAFAHRLQRKPDSKILYADEDRFDDQYQRLQPGFKPQFSLEKLLCTNYIHHPVVMSRSFFNEIGGLNSQYDGSQDYDLLLRAIEKTTAIEHIPDVLYHMRLHSNSLSSGAEAKPEAHAKGVNAIQAYLDRQNLLAKIKPTEFSGFHNLTYLLRQRPKTAILLLLNADAAEEENIRHNWQQNKEDEILICKDNSLSIPIRLNNLIHKTDADIVIFADAQLIPEPDCIDELLRHCILNKNGLVTGKLAYNDGALHSCGLTLGIRGCAGRWHYACGANDLGYGGWMAINHEVSAVPWQLMAVKKSLFLQAGLFDGQYIGHGFDVHLALKLSNEYSVNHLTIANAKAVFPYPCPQCPEFWNEQDFIHLWSHWQKILNQVDPYFNSNFSVFDEAITFSNHVEQHLKRFGLFNAYDKLTFKLLWQCFSLKVN